MHFAPDTLASIQYSQMLSSVAHKVHLAPDAPFFVRVSRKLSSVAVRLSVAHDELCLFLFSSADSSALICLSHYLLQRSLCSLLSVVLDIRSMMYIFEYLKLSTRDYMYQALSIYTCFVHCVKHNLYTEFVHEGNVAHTCNVKLEQH